VIHTKAGSRIGQKTSGPRDLRCRHDWRVFDIECFQGLVVESNRVTLALRGGFENPRRDGPCNDDGIVSLFDWSGKPSDAANLMREVEFGELNPEAMFVYPGDLTAVQFLSDDGGRKPKGVNRQAMVPAEQRFRGFSREIR
jgi:hypothetical protein